MTRAAQKPIILASTLHIQKTGATWQLIGQTTTNPPEWAILATFHQGAILSDLGPIDTLARQLGFIAVGAPKPTIQRKLRASSIRTRASNKQTIKAIVTAIALVFWAIAKLTGSVK